MSKVKSKGTPKTRGAKSSKFWHRGYSIPRSEQFTYSPYMTQMTSYPYATGTDQSVPPGTSQRLTGRVPVEPSWPKGGMVSKEMGDRNYTVQKFTGAPISTVGEGQWYRGNVVRFDSYGFRPNPHGLDMFDPTNDANRWDISG